jgi:hypothetical protein
MALPHACKQFVLLWLDWTLSQQTCNGPSSTSLGNGRQPNISEMQQAALPCAEGHKAISAFPVQLYCNALGSGTVGFLYDTSDTCNVIVDTHPCIMFIYPNEMR